MTASKIAQPSEHARLEKVRGTLPRARANARTVAALTDNPGCVRRRVIDGASVRAYELVNELGHPATRGQSPFAITSGNSFERHLKEGSEYRLLIDVLKPLVDLPATDLRICDLGKVEGMRIGPEWITRRVEMTEAVLAKIARNDADAPHLVDHPELRFDVAGAIVNLEPDALALRHGSGLQLVEIKSYPIIDGQADASKVSATAGQSAVYLLAIRAALQRLGFDPDILDWSVILVAPRNFGRTPTARRIPLRKKTLALQRVLGAAPRTETLLADLPQDFTFDVDPGRRLKPGARVARLDRAVRSLPMRYVPECIASCDMAQYCRHQAIVDDDPARLGRVARDALAGVTKLEDVLRFALNGVSRDEDHLVDVAEALSIAHGALTRARARAGLTHEADRRPGRARS